MGFYIPEDDILHSHRRENMSSYKIHVFDLGATVIGEFGDTCAKWCSEFGIFISYNRRLTVNWNFPSLFHPIPYPCSYLLHRHREQSIVMLTVLLCLLFFLFLFFPS
jgi:hypothetical protein